MFVELPLSTWILLGLNPSIMSIMTKRSSWGYFIPPASSFEKNMSMSIRLYFARAIMWTLFTCLWYDFLRDLNDPPVDGPPMIVFMSPITLCDRWDVWSSSLGEALCLSLLSSLDLLGCPFFTNLCNFPFCISSSIYSFRSLQSSVWWPWSLGNRQYFFLSRTLGDECNDLGHLR